MRRVTATAVLVLFGLMVSLTYAQEVEPVPIVGTDAAEILTGTPGKDSLYGRAGDDVLLAAAGEDELDGGPGADALSGGPDRDAVSYDGATADVTLDGVANDGVPGEGDNVLLDVEDVYGTEGPDKLIGNALENTLDGNAGNDQIIGGSNADGLFGGEGDDNINSRDGAPDRVECGPGTDVALIDVRDSVIECESIGYVATTENFTITIFNQGNRRATRFRLGNIMAGSRVTLACVSRCRPRTSPNRVLYRRTSIRPYGGNARLVNLRVSRSRFVAGATLEIGVKARKAKARCRRVKLGSRRGLISRLIFSKKRCTSVARGG